MAGLVPAIHVFSLATHEGKAWMPGTRPGMTADRQSRMHDLEFEHVHVENAPETRELRETIWAADNVELTTVGIDIGSSTSHLMFARVHLSRLSTGLSSRFVVVERKVLWQSPDPAHALPAGFHHRHRKARGVHPCRLRRGWAFERQGRLRRRHPHRRGAETKERARHRRPVLGRVGQIRLRLGRPSHGMPACGARLGRGEAFQAARQDAAQCRYRRRHHQAGADP